VDFSNDFSLYEQRRLAEIERELSGDHRLVAMMELLGSGRTTAWRRLACWVVRMRRPFAAMRGGSRWAKAGVLVALCLMVAIPALLVVALGLGLATVAMIAVCALPIPPVLMAITYHRATHPGGGNPAARES
jgi:hypothetical protein